ncbi:hypothetical protein IQ07DRAFT_583890 [Pyrenochaeta sp. DS3sAY3a]|nr:hypothetical protein IQ07DRAFT_583890 [Pyrenochaeta sp. DS3sAY3a]
MQQHSYGYQQTPYDYAIGQQVAYSHHAFDEIVEKPSHPNVVEIPHQTKLRATQREKYYVPTALRTPALLAFCLLALTVFALLQFGSAKFVGAHGLDSLVKSPSKEKRAAFAQSSDTPYCPPGATCAPNPASWSNPYDPEHSIEPATGPNPGSYGSADARYFLGAYVPTLVAIGFSIWWKCIFASLKETEPFHQLTKPGGARVDDSLLLSYAGSMLPVVILKSFLSRHWLTMIGAVNMVLITVCTLFAAETMFLIGEGDGCGVIVNAKGDYNKDCDIELTMRPALGFVLGIILFAVVLLAILVVGILRRSSTGLFAEATSIAGLSSLASLQLCRVSRQSLENSRSRYTICPSQSGPNVLVELPQDAPQPSSVQPLDDLRVKLTRTKKEGHWEMSPYSLAFFFLFQTGILVLIIYYRYVSKPGTGNALENFMNSESFGVRLFMTVLGLGTKFYWGWIEKYVRHAWPYLMLAEPEGASADQSVLVKSSGHPITALFNRSTWKSPLVAAVTLMATFSEVLVITLNAVPFTIATAYQAFRISVYISMVILALMITTNAALIIWRIVNIRKLNIPHIPECIADVLDLLEDGQGWNALGALKEKERDGVVRNWNQKYGIRKLSDRWVIVAWGSMGR